MKNNNYTFIVVLTALLLLNSLDANANKRKVLFIGNSYIYTNDVPLLLKQMVTSFKDTFDYDQNTPGGYTLQAHSADVTTIGKINAQNWDVVIVQEQSQRPAFDPAQVQQDTYPYARKIDSLVKDHYSCSETMFMMTWGYKNGDGGNCPFYPPICTYAGMQARLRESYLEMTMNNNASVAPVGAAWKMARDSFPTIDLYSPDNSHPSLHGSYLETCVLYASIFHKNPLGSTFTAGLPAADAEKLQRIAGRIVLDSIGKWQQYGNYAHAQYTHIVTNNIVTFQNKSQKATNYYWNFGDGTNSTSANPPAKTYSQFGKFAVSLMAGNNCNSIVYTDTIQIGVTGVTDIIQDKGVQIKQAGGGNISIELSSKHSYNNIDIYDIAGRRVISNIITPGTTSFTVELVPGVYIYKIQSKEQGSVSGKFSVY
jgi:hypothetical protein